MDDLGYKKDFDRWNTIKKTLDATEIFTPFKEGEVWWASLGVNIGREEDGKHEKFERPVIVLKKYNRDKLLIAPTTSKERDGQYIYGHTHDGIYYGIIFSQLRTISARRLSRIMWRMEPAPFQQLLEKVRRSL